MRNSPWLVMIDLQKDFYHPQGCYGRAGRPLAPIHTMIRRLSGFVEEYPHVLRVASHYGPGQWPDMPGLCEKWQPGGGWHPELEVGPLIVKRKQSGFSVIKSYFENEPCPLILAGLCTHRCVRATLQDFLQAGWPVKILENAVASCGLRQAQHNELIEKWSTRNLLQKNKVYEKII